jgi:predicted NUDIX family NTP pyrophosphohydrolase
MPKISAGLLMCRYSTALQFFLVHPGGPFYKNKNEGVWSIPKGEADVITEDLLTTAKREFKEETGITPLGEFEYLGTVKLKSGKIIHAWSFMGKWDPSSGIVSNTFPLEWPPHSGKHIQVPEVDRAAWCTYEEAIHLIHPAQKKFLDRAKDLYFNAPNIS